MLEQRPAAFLRAVLANEDFPAADSVDLVAFFPFAQHHRLTPLVTRWLRQRSLPVPPEYGQRVRDVAVQNLALLAHTGTVCTLLKTAGIDAISLKGPTLSCQLYDEPHYRVCSDVDVLVRESQFKAAARLLSASGYRADVALDDRSLRALRARRHDLAFAHDDGTLIELHADIAQPHYSYHAHLGRWFDRAASIEIGGRDFPILAAEHALFLAIVHGTKHAWERLDLVADVVALARGTLDWVELRRVVKEAGAERAAATAFLLAQFLANRANHEFKSKAAEAMAGEAAQRLMRSEELSYWQTRRFDLRVRDRVRDRLRYLSSFARAAGDKMLFARKAHIH